MPITCTERRGVDLVPDDSSGDELEKIYRHEEEELKSPKGKWRHNAGIKYGGAITAFLGVCSLTYYFIAYAGAQRNYPVSNVDMDRLFPCISIGTLMVIIGLALYVSFDG